MGLVHNRIDRRGDRAVFAERVRNFDRSVYDYSGVVAVIKCFLNEPDE